MEHEFFLPRAGNNNMEIREIVSPNTYNITEFIGCWPGTNFLHMKILASLASGTTMFRPLFFYTRLSIRYSNIEHHSYILWDIYSDFTFLLAI